MKLVERGIVAAGFSGLAVGLVGCGVWNHAAAASRPCLPSILVIASDAKSEIEARRKVLLAWSAEARKNGEAFTSWRLAWRKSVDCGRLPTGEFQCRAAAQPCGISQVPGTLPPGSKPQPRAKPGDA